jgi:hypothetical protein
VGEGRKSQGKGQCDGRKRGQIERECEGLAWGINGSRERERVGDREIEGCHLALIAGFNEEREIGERENNKWERVSEWRELMRWG